MQVKNLLTELIGKNIYCIYSDKVEIFLYEEEGGGEGTALQMGPFILLHIEGRRHSRIKLIAKPLDSDDDIYVLEADDDPITEANSNDFDFSKYLIRPTESIKKIEMYANIEIFNDSDPLISMIALSLKKKVLYFFPAYTPFGSVSVSYQNRLSDSYIENENLKLVYSVG